MIFVLLSVLAALLDQRLKDGIESQPPGLLPLSLAGGKITLKRVHNPGFLMNAGSKHPRAVRAAVSGVLLLLAAGFLSVLALPGRFLLKAGMSLMTGGAASNAADRFRRGYVVDYCSVSWKRVRHLVFNLGDLFLAFGALLSLLFLLFGPEE